MTGERHAAAPPPPPRIDFNDGHGLAKCEPPAQRRRYRHGLWICPRCGQAWTLTQQQPPNIAPTVISWWWRRWPHVPMHQGGGYDGANGLPTFDPLLTRDTLADDATELRRLAEQLAHELSRPLEHVVRALSQALGEPVDRS